jgi:hypothetical protein
MLPYTFKTPQTPDYHDQPNGTVILLFALFASATFHTRDPPNLISRRRSYPYPWLAAVTPLVTVSRYQHHVIGGTSHHTRIFVFEVSFVTKLLFPCPQSSIMEPCLRKIDSRLKMHPRICRPLRMASENTPKKSIAPFRMRARRIREGELLRMEKVLRGRSR